MTGTTSLLSRWSFVTTAFLTLVSFAPALAARSAERATLAPTGADPDASGIARVVVRSRRSGLDGRFDVRVRRLESAQSYDVTLDGVRLGTLTTNRRGKGKLRLQSRPRGGAALLGVDPRGRAVGVVDAGGAVVLGAAMPASSLDPGDVRCCLPDDSGTECEDRTAAECAAEGGVNLGAGTCLPNPCAGAPVPPVGDVVCCLPDDSGPECEDRTSAECAAQGGVVLETTTCAPNPCAPVTPPGDSDVRCCLPDDSGTECEDRTAAECAAEGGVNIGPGACAPGACLGGPGGTTTTTLPGGSGGTVRVRCERRGDRSKVSVDGNGLAPGSYGARVTSGANEASAPPRPTVGDEVEHDFDSEPDDIAAGAVAIAADFLTGSPVSATGAIVDANGAVVVAATVTCRVE